ncbi:MAG TPA: undecaprenyl-phosphate glucose phosphotransferase, partial [Burkholderiaceae bacterium]|nr:undecaprenyl-phosphate glucose phosphotransferase [Burkholderiaceae bacterium]
MANSRTGPILATSELIRTGNRSLIAFAKAVTDPLVAVVCLFAATLAWGHTVGPAEMILAVIVFSLMYPANTPFRYRQRGLIRHIAASWALVVGLLLAFGLAIDMLKVFDQNVLATWVIGTPLIQTLGHWVSPVVVPRLLALRGEHTAIIIGANELGRTLARQIVGDPLSSTRVAAFFDDREVARLGESL